MPESFTRRTLGRPAFLREHEVRFQVPDHTRPVAGSIQASCPQKVVGNNSHVKQLLSIETRVSHRVNSLSVRNFCYAEICVCASFLFFVVLYLLWLKTKLPFP